MKTIWKNNGEKHVNEADYEIKELNEIVPIMMNH